MGEWVRLGLGNDGYHDRLPVRKKLRLFGTKRFLVILGVLVVLTIFYIKICT